MQSLLMTKDNLQASVEGRKTVTRRVIKNITSDYVFCGTSFEGYCFGKTEWLSENHHSEIIKAVKPRYHVGEVVYFKEPWVTLKIYDELRPRHIPDVADIWYPLGADLMNIPSRIGKLRSPLFMPAWAARYFAEILDVRVERLQEITEEDAIKEGIKIMHGTHQSIEKDVQTGKLKLVGEPQPFTAKYHFGALWDSINPKYPWSSNPFVFRYEYRMKEKYPAEIKYG